MANLRETSTWENGIYQIEENDPVHGGENGITNRPAKQLANRTKWLNDNKVPKTATITAGNGLTGGGDLSTNRSLALGTPSQITATSSNSVTAESHSHAIDKASTTVAGIVQLNDSLTSTSNTQALTANQGKLLEDKKLDKTTVFTVEGNNKVYRYHDVAMFNKRTEPVIGVVALKLPSYFTTMYMMTLQGFNYDHSSSWSAEISAYQYTATSVIKPSITIHGNPPFDKIRFASKNGGHYILFGDTNTIWRYPNIHVKDVLTHYVNQQHWATGYEFSLETDLSTFQILATPILYGTPRALSAEKLFTPRQLSISGDATAAANFDGSANANLALTLTNTGVTAGNYQSVTVDNKGRVTAGLNIVNGLVTATTATGTANQATTNNNTYLNLVTRIGTTNSSAGSSTKITGQNGVTVSSDTNGNLLIGGDLVNHINNNDANRPASAWLTNYLHLNKLGKTENAASASKLQTARTINGLAFDGTQNITIADQTKVAKLGDTLTGTLNSEKRVKKATLQQLHPNDTPFTISNISYDSGETGYLAFLHGSAQTTGFGYRSHVSYGLVRGSNTWQDSGAYIAVGGNDNYPTEAFQFLYGRKIKSTAGLVELEGTAVKLQTPRTINGVAFDGTRNITIIDDTKVEKAQKSAGTDARTLKQDGIYSLGNGGINLPTTSGAYKILSLAGNNPAWVHQLAIKAYSTEIWLTSQQSANSEEWLAWKRLDGADWADIRDKPTTLNGYSNLINNNYLHWSGTATPAPVDTDFAISSGRIQCLGSICINADSNNNHVNAEHILLTASNGVSSDVNTGLAIRSNGVKWKNGRHEIADNGDMIVRNPNGYSGLNLTGTDGSFIRIESNPTLATSATSFGKLIYRSSAGANQAVISLPHKNGVMLLSTDIVNAVNNTNATAPASANAVKTAYDKAVNVEQQLNQFKTHTHTVSQISDFIAQVQAQIRAGLQIQRKDYSATLTPTHNNFRTQTVNVTGSVEVLPDGRIIQRFTFVCPVAYFHRYGLSAFYREKLGVTSFAAEDTPLLELPLWTAMPNKVQEARIHLSANLNHNAWGEALEWAYDWDSIFNQHVNIKDKAYFAFRRWGGSQDEPVTFNIVVEGY